MGRIEERLAMLEHRREKALALFVTAGYPRLTSTVDIALALEQGGADILELGMPFSDPLADGPVIQESSTAALRNGITLRKILCDVRALRRHSAIPLALMGYLNPILRFGVKEFMREAADAGVDALILPELPLEEASWLGDAISANGLSQILLVTPTSSQERIEAIDAASGGFLYCVSTTGVTGSKVLDSVDGYLKRVKEHARRNKVLVGFGISTPDDAKRLAEHVDGVIVGSALIRKIGEGSSPEGLSSWVALFKRAITGD